MKFKREGTVIQIEIEGSIGETSPFFTIPIKDSTEIIIDMDKMTYMNSIGVKNWIIWTMKIPSKCEVKLLNAPVLIASQASMVQGFVTPKIKIESVRIPYACESCGLEKSELAQANKDFFYENPPQQAKLALIPEMPCPKCQTGKLELDIIPEKTFRFLKTR